MEIEAQEQSFAGADGRYLFERRWLPVSAPRAALIIVHGYAEHSGRYAHVGQHLAGAGYAVYAFDLRGHGLSDGKRASVRSFAEYLADLRLYVARVREHARGLPVFVLGHSMGGGIVALFASVDAPAVRGVLLSGAVLPNGGAAGWILARAVELFAKVAPDLPTFSLSAASVSRDEDVVRRYEDDPLVYHGRIRAGLAAAMSRAARRIARDERTIDLPLLIMHGTDDALTSPDGSRRLYERAASLDKTLKLYDGLYHEILNEPEQLQVLADIVVWLDARC